MDPERKPEVVDLNRYKQAARDKAKRAVQAARPAREPLLGSRPRAGLILIAVIVVLVLLAALAR